MQLDELQNKKILILGFAREGLSSLKFLRKMGVKKNIFVADKRAMKEFEMEYRSELKKFAPRNLNLGKKYLDELEEFDVIVKTAGLKLDERIIKRLKKKGLEITTNQNLFLSQAKGKVVGVTGTKGKSTTASLLYSILKVAGEKVVLAGNMGKPLLDYLRLDNKETIFVVEFSSYQLEMLNQPKIDIAVITNLFPEHLDYHGSIRKYYGAKMNIVKMLKPKGVLVIGKIFREKNFITRKDIKVMNCADVVFNYETKLKGEHNQKNIILATTVAKLLKIKEKTLARAVKNFRPLGHRLEFAGKFKGIKFYNDVLSTTPESTIEAIESLKEEGLQTIIVGGMDRGLDYKKLAKKIVSAKIDNVIYWPHTGVKIAEEIREMKSSFRPNLVVVKNMRETVKKSFNLTKKNGVVLLSPAASSYDFYANYREKGVEFKKLIK